MNKTLKHLFLALALFCYAQVRAQTTDLIYHLGKASSTVKITSVATDASGNIFVCGSFTGNSVEFNPLGTSTPEDAQALESGFIASYTTNGILRKVIAFGTSLNNKGLKVYVDPANQNVYLLAIVSGTIDMTGEGGFGSTAVPSNSMTLVKYDKMLTFKNVNYINNGIPNGNNLLGDLTTFGTNIYITGQLDGANFEFNPKGTSKKISSTGGSDIFVAKYDTATFINGMAYAIGGINNDGGTAIDLDNSGNIYLTGYFRGQNIDIDPIGSISVSEDGGGNATGDAFVAKYNASMACQWGFNIGASQTDQGNDILVNRTNGTVYVGGYVKKDARVVYFDPSTTSSSGFTGVGLNDIFVASYTTAGAYNWHLATGSTGEDELASLGFDQGGNIVLAGFASGDVNFGNSKTITGKGGKDAFFAVVSGTSGMATSAYNLGGTNDEQATSTAVDVNGKILVVGNYKGSGDYDIGAANTTPLSGTQDGFITRHVLCLPPSITTQPVNKISCEGQTTSLSVVASNATTYQWKKGAGTISGATNATYSISTTAIADAGNYSVVVGNACQSIASTTITVTVNPKPSINSASTSASCSGSGVGYTIGSAVTSNYSWTRAAVANISPSPVSGSTASINESLVNGANAPIDVIYIITPTSTVGTCVGNPFSLTVTVNPKPIINSSATGTICSGIAQSYSITSPIASTYKWSRSAVAGITNTAVSNQTSNPIVETLTNNSVNPVTVVYSITPTSTSGTCIGSVFSYSVTVNPSVSSSVSIAADKTTICAGDLLTLTATPVNGGTPPLYQWKKGGVAISEATNATYKTSTTANADSYTVEMNSSLTCASVVPVVSSPLVITVTPVSNTSLTMSASSTTICAGTNIVFTAVATNAGAATYQWKMNNAVISGATNSTYNTNAATNGDYFSVVMTSPLACASPKSIGTEYVTILLTAHSVEKVTVSASKTEICANGSIDFSTTVENAGLTATYQWKKGTADILGATNSTYTTSGASNGDTYSVVMTSSLTCVSPKVVQSTAIPITVTPIKIPTISFTASKTTICASEPLTLTANSTNGGGNPLYKWKLGSGYIPGATNSTYTTTSTLSGDSYSVEMTSDLNCAAPATKVSTPIAITVNPVTITTVAAVASNTTICPGENIVFTATPGNGGTPTYQWKKGTTDISLATNNTYNTSSAANGDTYSVVMTSSLACPSPKTVQSTAIPISVTSSFTPSVAISATETVICANTSITLTATPTNGGAATYKWKLGANYISGATNATYVTTTAANNDSYTVEMTNPSNCASPNTVVSSPIVIKVNPILVPVATITSASTTICASDLITFNLTTSNEGATPSYEWYKNGAKIIPSATGISYATTSAATGDKFKVALTSNALCANTSPVFSNELTITVNPLPTISGVVDVCEGSTISLTGSGTANSTLPWVSSNTANASVTNLGIVAGVLVGTSTITYTNNNGCKVSTTINVNAKPTITGILSVCAGSTTQLTGTNIPAATNAWVSASTSVATISNTGLVSGLVSGVSVITYKTIAGCTNTVTITVLSLPTITGTPNVCVGSTTQLIGSGSPAATNAWVSATNIVATVNNNGLVSGIAPGTSIISYINSSGCQITQLITVNPTLVPSVSISANNSTICVGTNVAFTATPINGGTPTYKWKLGTNYIAGATNSSYNTSGATNGESYSVEMTSNALCASTTTVNSSPIVITVTTSVLPTITAVANPVSPICDGTSVTFTATPGNEGTAPTYQWKKGGVVIPSATNKTYVSSSIVNGDKISVDMVSNSTCASTPNATSNIITMVVTPNVSASVIVTSTETAICSGKDVTFTAAPTNQGAAPMYEWFVNNVSQGVASTSPTFHSTTLINNNTVKVKLTSNATCVTTPTVPSNDVTMTVTANVTPTIAITSDKSTICTGETVNFTASSTNAGTVPIYQWKINGVNSGMPSSSTAFSSSSLTTGKTVTVELTSSASCVTQSVVVSTGIQITVPVTTQIVAQPQDQSVCALGDNVTFTVSAVGAGLTYQWKIGGTSLANNTTYTGTLTKSLTVSNVSNSDLVGYTVDVTGTCGNVTSSVANLNQSASSITIVTQPTAQSKQEGEMIQLSVSATGPTLSYQWRKNNVNLVDDSRISGANTSSLQISNAVMSDAGNTYTCLINSPCATQLMSNAAKVTVTALPTSIQDAHAKGFRIAPNPSNGFFNISNNFMPFNVNEIEIISMQGVVVAVTKVKGTTSLDEDINAQDLPKGMYMVLVKGDSDQALLKIVIDK